MKKRKRKLVDNKKFSIRGRSNKVDLTDPVGTNTHLSAIIVNEEPDKDLIKPAYHKTDRHFVAKTSLWERIVTSIRTLIKDSMK